MRFFLRDIALASLLVGHTDALQPFRRPISRRAALFSPASALLPVVAVALPSDAATPNGLNLSTSPSGLKWADAKIGSGGTLQTGAAASIDYAMASTGGRSPQLYNTQGTGAPYRWVLGDGSTIAGLETAILGDEKEGIAPMRPGGIRRLIIPSKLAYAQLSVQNAKCVEGKDGAVGPIPPLEDFGAYNRWKQLYCNPRIPYQPDLVFDIKLYGKRTID